MKSGKFDPETKVAIVPEGLRPKGILGVNGTQKLNKYPV